MKKYSPPAQCYYRTKGLRHYEITNHLGNVMATISDRKLGQSPDGDTLINYYHADLLSAQDYYPGGMLMPGRSYSSDSYKFGFGGQEKDDEIAGTGNIYSALYWEYDSRSLRRWNLEPVLLPSQSPYLCFNGYPILYSDPNGDFATIDDAIISFFKGLFASRGNFDQAGSSRIGNAFRSSGRHVVNSEKMYRGYMAKQYPHVNKILKFSI